MKKFLLLTVCVLSLVACDDSGSDKQNGQGEGQAQQQSQGQGGPGGGQGQQKANVGYITIRPQQVSITNELPGRVQAFKTAEIRPQVSGIIEERLFEEGSLVEKGQQLYQIDPARYDADYQMAQANLQNARAQYNSASALANRYQRLIEQNAVSQQEYDDAKAARDQAKAAIAVAEAEVKTAKINLEYTKVYSPISGYIGPSAVTEGALVTAQQETALATVRQLDPVYVDLTQSAAEAQQIQKRLTQARLEGQRDQRYAVTLILNNTGETYPVEGVLDATDLAVNEETGSIRLRSVFDNPNTVLLPGMFVRANVEMTGGSEAILVPQKAVSIQPTGSKTVWVVGANGQAQKQEVQTGAAYNTNWVILNGIEPGDKVIVENTMMLREGAPLNANPLNNGEAEQMPEDMSVPSDTVDDRSPAPDDSLSMPEQQPSQSKESETSSSSNEGAE